MRGRNKEGSVPANFHPGEYNPLFVMSIENITSKLNDSCASALQFLRNVNMTRPVAGCILSTVSTVEVINIMVDLNVYLQKTCMALVTIFCRR